MIKKDLTKEELSKIQLLLCHLQDITMYNVQSLNYRINHNCKSFVLENDIYDMCSNILSYINEILLYFEKENNYE